MGNNKYALMIALTLLLTMAMLLMGCGKAPGVTHYPLTFVGSSAKGFHQGAPMEYGNQRVVDSSVLNVNGELKAFLDWGDSAFFGSENIVNGMEVNFTPTHTGLNFTYTIYQNGNYYNFGWMGGNIYLDKSADGIHWTRINGGRPVLHREMDPTSNWYSIYNVGVDVDTNGLWHLVVECMDSAPNELNVGLCYSNATMNGDEINFDTNKLAQQVVAHGGNPYLKILPGQGMLIVHGQANDATGPFGKEWYVTATTVAEGTMDFVTHKDKFMVGTPGIHDCDPHMAMKPDGELLLVLSVDQSHVATATAGTTLESLFDSLTN